METETSVFCPVQVRVGNQMPDRAIFKPSLESYSLQAIAIIDIYTDK